MSDNDNKKSNDGKATDLTEFYEAVGSMTGDPCLKLSLIHI